MRPPSTAVALLPSETEFEMRILVDRCIVEAFLMGGRVAFTSHGPRRSDPAEIPGTEIRLFSTTGVTVTSAVVHSMSCGWTDPPTIGNGPFAH
jgi:sucrose-6-phosphate hydrolase SacC (GH32 family)